MLPILVVHEKSHTGSDGWLVVSGVELHAGSRWEGLGPRITACLQLATEYSIPDYSHMVIICTAPIH